MKGIIFKSDMIQAAVEGRKTQTRRVIKPQPKYLKGKVYSQWFWCKRNMTEVEALQLGVSHAIWWDGVKSPRVMTAFAPYHVGETVYIKEAFYRYGWWIKNGISKTGRQQWRFKFAPSLETDHIGGEDFRYYENPPSDIKPNSYRGEGWYKRSPLFMSEWAARHFITILAVKAERLNCMSEEDALKEGVTIIAGTHQPIVKNPETGELEVVGHPEQNTARYHFAALWDSINPKYPWESNPFVFVYTFEMKLV